MSLFSFAISDRARDLQVRVAKFVEENVYPAEETFERQLRGAPTRWSVPPVIEELKKKARAEGLWNLFMPGSEHGGAGLTNLEYAPLCESMGGSPIAPEVFNCNAPDTGNMEVLARYGTDPQQKEWLHSLLAGEIRSCFAMTEPAVASSDATNIACKITGDGDDYVINGRKWWTSGALDPRCKLAIVMGRTSADAPKHLQQSMVLVPMSAKGIEILRPLTVFGYDDAPHGHAEIVFRDVRVPKSNVLLGEGRGFEIAQGRLGPGRIHHCMRAIGLAERALARMCRRAEERVAFGRPLAELGGLRQQIAESRVELEQARLLTLSAAHAMDTVGNKEARKLIAMIKVAAPRMAGNVIDRAIQVHGAAGISQDFPLAYASAWARALRILDGPDEVHLETIAKQELKEQRGRGGAVLNSGPVTVTGVVTDVRAAHRFDEMALRHWLEGRLPGATESLVVRQFEGGQSNPTFLLETPAGRWVLRKKPGGQLAESAHLIEREHRVLVALQGTGVPVPAVPLSSDDPSIIGTPFFVMSYVHGRIERDPSLPNVATTAERSATYFGAVAAMAKLHGVDWQARGLSDFGKHTGYVARQVARWTRQYKEAKVRPIPALDWLADWLRERVPTAESPVTIAHGDFRLDNLVLHPTEPRTLAVLDWELSTLGEPLTDLAYFFIAHRLPVSEQGIRGLVGVDREALGIPSEDALIAAYAQARGIAMPSAELMRYYLVFGIFRLAAIAVGIEARMLSGNASSDNARHIIAQTETFAETARALANDR